MAKHPQNKDEINARIKKIKGKLEQIKQMKKLLLADGIKPDASDKERESTLIQQLLGLEKDLSRDEKKTRREKRNNFNKTK